MELTSFSYEKHHAQKGGTLGFNFKTVCVIVHIFSHSEVKCGGGAHWLRSNGLHGCQLCPQKSQTHSRRIRRQSGFKAFTSKGRQQKKV